MAATRADEKNDLSEDLPRERDLETTERHFAISQRNLKPIEDLVLRRVWQALMNSNKSWSRRLSALEEKLAEHEQQRRQFAEQALEHGMERQTSKAMKENDCRTIQ